jgi:multidrug resistance protein MdtO
MTSIVQLALLVAAVAALAGWIAIGSERTAYAGLQIAFAFHLAVLADFAPLTDVTEVRDRLIGIVFGVVVMALVFSYVWPERAGTSMVQSLATALRRMGELAVGGSNSSAARAPAWQALAAADKMATLFAFEPDALSASGAEHGRRVQRLIDLTRRVLLAQAALVQHRKTAPPAAPDATVTLARTALDRAIGAALTDVATAVDTASAAAQRDLRAPLAALSGIRPASEPAALEWLDSEVALLEALEERVAALQRAVAIA